MTLSTIIIIYLTVGVIVGIVSVTSVFKKENAYVRDKLDVTFFGALLISFLYHTVCWPIILMK